MVWIKRWAGSYTFISCSYWGVQYYTALKETLGVCFEDVLFIHRKGTVSFFVTKEDLDHLGRYLAGQVVKDNTVAVTYCNKLKENTNNITPILKNPEIPSQEQYTTFLTFFERHLSLHVFVKKTVDYLPEGVLQTLLPLFNDARTYSEHVYSETERFFRAVMDKIADVERRNSEHLTCLTQAEFEEYLATKALPPEDELVRRYACSALKFRRGTQEILLGDEVDELERKIADEIRTSDGTVTGVTGHGGNVEGACRVILDPHDATMNDGEILVTGQTRPEFMHLIKKAAAIVTDSGGVLCHAAITSRELKLPCVVGTEIATQVFHNGDVVHVDADNGVVRKITDHREKK